MPYRSLRPAAAGGACLDHTAGALLLSIRNPPYFEVFGPPAYGILRRLARFDGRAMDFILWDAL